MIGIDVARVKRWFVKYYTQYDTTDYRVEVEKFNVTAIDPKGGIDASFEVKAYNADNEAVFTATGVYNRKHYGGWDAHV